MAGWIRNIIIIFAILSAVYALLVMTANIRQRRKLRAEFDVSETSDTKDAFVEEGLKRYNRSLRPKMLLGVYLVPLLIMGALIYLAQYG
jgi:hypothetical protein